MSAGALDHDEHDDDWSTPRIDAFVRSSPKLRVVPDARPNDSLSRSRRREASEAVDGAVAELLKASVFRAAGEGAIRAAIERGVAHLLRTQRADGSWDEPEFTGTGFPVHFYLNYHQYRLHFPLTALGRYAASACPDVVAGRARNDSTG